MFDISDWYFLWTCFAHWPSLSVRMLKWKTTNRWESKMFYLKEPRVRGRKGAWNHRWRNFLDDLKEQIGLDREKIIYKKIWMTIKANTHAVFFAPSCFFFCMCQSLPPWHTHREAQTIIKNQVDPFWEIHSHLVWLVTHSICIMVRVWRWGKCRKFACKWIPQAEPMHQNTVNTRDKPEHLSTECAIT